MGGKKLWVVLGTGNMSLCLESGEQSVWHDGRERKRRGGPFTE